MRPRAMIDLANAIAHARRAAAPVRLRLERSARELSAIALAQMPFVHSAYDAT
jgi:hypothetical protein